MLIKFNIHVWCSYPLCLHFCTTWRWHLCSFRFTWSQWFYLRWLVFNLLARIYAAFNLCSLMSDDPKKPPLLQWSRLPSSDQCFKFTTMCHYLMLSLSGNSKRHSGCNLSSCTLKHLDMPLVSCFYTPKMLIWLKTWSWQALAPSVR